LAYNSFALILCTSNLRFQEDMGAAKQKSGNSTYSKKPTIKPNRSWAYTTSSKTFPQPYNTLKEGTLSRVFSEDYDSLLDVKKNLFDPHGSIVHRWNRIFLVACLASLFVDPLFFYLPSTSKMGCIKLTTSLEAVLTIIRSLADVFYFVQIYVKFRTAFVAPSSTVFGRGELVIEPSEIASRYLKRSFWVDLLAAIPLPQVSLHSLIMFFLFNFW
jgi:cyclic nucleotide gated channel, plant